MLNRFKRYADINIKYISVRYNYVPAPTAASVSGNRRLDDWSGATGEYIVRVRAAWLPSCRNLGSTVSNSCRRLSESAQQWQVALCS